jgi:hypothetical protein
MCQFSDLLRQVRSAIRTGRPRRRAEVQHTRHIGARVLPEPELLFGRPGPTGLRPLV